MSMIESSNFREINKIEREIIFQSLSKISTNIFQFLIRSKNKLYISLKDSKSRTNFPNIYLSSIYFEKEIDIVKSKKEICSVGIYFGFIKKGNFHLSLEGAEFLNKQGILFDVKCLYVNKKGEKSILYGNNILKNMVIKTPSNLQKDDFLLIFNDLNEILAIAQSKIESNIIQNLKPKDIVALNMSDKGTYLREKQ